MTKIAIIGNGRFGDLLYKTFENKSKKYEPYMHSRRVEVADGSSVEKDGKRFISFDDIATCEIVIPTVPISYFEETAKALGETLWLYESKKFSDQKNKVALVVDVASVKVHTTKMLRTYLPDSVEILSTHPMFGPDSTKDGTTFEGLKFIYSKEKRTLPCQAADKRQAQDDKEANTISSSLINEFIKFWKDLGCEMIEMSPEEHDKQAAYTHAFAFLIGQIGIDLRIRRNDISTKGFEGILYNQEAVENDTGQLFDDMMKFNPYAKEMRKKVMDSLKEIEKRVS